MKEVLKLSWLADMARIPAFQGAEAGGPLPMPQSEFKANLHNQVESLSQNKKQRLGM